MGPYVIVHAQPGKNTVALAHTIFPTPPHEKATLISAISDLIIFEGDFHQPHAGGQQAVVLVTGACSSVELVGISQGDGKLCA